MTDANQSDGKIDDSLSDYCQELSIEKLQIATKLKLAHNKIDELQDQLKKAQEENTVLNERFALLQAGMPGGSH